MGWRADLQARLRADAQLAALCGARISWFESARSHAGIYPRVVMQQVTPGRDYTHDGPDGLDHPSVQFDIFAADGAQAEAVETVLLAVMEAGGTRGGTLFHNGFLQGTNLGDPVDMADQDRAYRISMDFEFHHEAV